MVSIFAIPDYSYKSEYYPESELYPKADQPLVESDPQVEVDPIRPGVKDLAVGRRFKGLGSLPGNNLVSYIGFNTG